MKKYKNRIKRNEKIEKPHLAKLKKNKNRTYRNYKIQKACLAK